MTLFVVLSRGETHTPSLRVVECSSPSYLKGFNSSQVGSLAGAAHLLNANAGVLRVTPQEQKSCLEYKGKSYLDQFIQ